MDATRVQSGIEWPSLGFGVGLRSEHYQRVVSEPTDGDWFGAVSESCLATQGRPLAVLEAVRRDHPLAWTGVGLSIGSCDPLDPHYLESLARLVRRVQPQLVTDHLCWTGVDRRCLYDLLPLPYTEEVLAHVSERVRRVQDLLGRRILLENEANYIDYRCSQMPEHEFLAALAERADCGILLDLNNVYVSATNHGFSAEQYIEAIPVGRVGQFHLAGFTDMGDYLFDTHSAPVCEQVWRLYARAVRRFGADVPTLVEWDAEIPPFERLREECRRARRRADTAIASRGENNERAA